VWQEDVRLMKEAGVNLVNVGVFAWALLEPAPGSFDFGWLDRVVGLLDDNGIRVGLGTPTAAPPAWFFRQHPGTRPVTREGHELGGGSRHAFCPSSPPYRAAAARITTRLAERYGGHPAVALWHVHNEYGWANAACYCATSASAFREWLRSRYGSLGTLNEAWGTTFWGQVYADWAEIEPPRLGPPGINPAQQLDFLRFSSDEQLACFRAERDILHRLAPGIPVTTNFMIANGKWMDYWRWAAEVDVVANDHYLRAERPDNHIDLALSADLTRSLAGGRPWLLLEHSTSAVNWQPRNIAKTPGEMRRNSYAHLARGADSALFFQWRASRRGAEKFHSAMLPHGGPRGRIWNDVVRLGAELAGLDELAGTRVRASVGIVWDWQSWWALDLEWRPSVDLDYEERVAAFYERVWRAHHTADFVHPSGALSSYEVVLVPSLYLLTAADAANLEAYVRGGGTLIVSYFSGIVDEHDAVHPGGHPGALRSLLGLEVEEFLPLRAGDRVGLSPSPPADARPALPANVRASLSADVRASLSADVWAEHIVLEGADAVLDYADGPAAGGPAVTRHRVGEGTAWYLSTRLDGAGLDLVLREAGLAPRDDVPDGVEVVRRAGPSAEYLVAINHGERDCVLPGAGKELLTGTPYHGSWPVPAGDVRVLRIE
jgi:beta-galactosidase